MFDSKEQYVGKLSRMSKGDLILEYEVIEKIFAIENVEDSSLIDLITDMEFCLLDEIVDRYKSANRKNFRLVR